MLTVLTHGGIYRVGNAYVRTTFRTEFSRAKSNPAASLCQLEERALQRVELPCRACVLDLCYPERVLGHLSDREGVRKRDFCIV